MSNPVADRIEDTREPLRRRKAITRINIPVVDKLEGIGRRRESLTKLRGWKKSTIAANRERPVEKKRTGGINRFLKQTVREITQSNGDRASLLFQLTPGSAQTYTRSKTLTLE